MGSKTIVFLGLLATILLVTSEVAAARDLAETSKKTTETAKQTKGVEEAKYPGGDQTYGGYPGGGGTYGGYPGGGGTYGGYPPPMYGGYPPPMYRGYPPPTYGGYPGGGGPGGGGRG